MYIFHFFCYFHNYLVSYFQNSQKKIFRDTSLERQPSQLTSSSYNRPLPLHYSSHSNQQACSYRHPLSSWNKPYCENDTYNNDDGTYDSHTYSQHYNNDKHALNHKNKNKDYYSNSLININNNNFNKDFELNYKNNNGKWRRNERLTYKNTISNCNDSDLNRIKADNSEDIDIGKNKDESLVKHNDLIFRKVRG